ncbi:MAG: LuxR C-terminal-related transcriptional regulator [Kineosporiaceae bacterium]
MAVLGTKLHVPSPRHQLVSRPRLTGLLPAGGSAMPRLVLVSAPAGFGKTTVLAQWLATGAGLVAHVAWLSLDEGDNDPRRFLAHLVAALRRSNPDGSAGTAALMEVGGEVPAQAVLTSLVNELDEVDGTTVLTLDDYHVIDDPRVHDCVGFLLEHLPPQATIAIATRADPPLPLARLRSRAELVELRAADLRFTTAEAEVFLNRVMDLHVPPDQVAALDARTEGWAAGLQLAGLSMRGRRQPAAFVDAFTGSHRFVLDYLVEEVLGSLAENVRGFLLDTCALDGLTGPLCDALTGRADGQRMLHALDRDNLFIVALDDRRQWYRYHHLFADALRARLAAEDPGRVPRLHRAASRWYADHDLLEDAVAHALAGLDAEATADLIERALREARRHRRDRMIQEWLRALPDDVIRKRPILATQQAWMRLVEGDLDGVEARLQVAESALDAMPAAERATTTADDALRTLPAWIAIYRASAAQARGDAAATADNARRALELAGPEDHFARGGAAGFLGLAAWAEGDLEVAVDTFTHAVTSLRSAGNVTDELGSTVVLADMWEVRGHPVKARRLYEQALSTAQQHPGVPLQTTGDLHVGLAGVLREQGELDAAEQHLRISEALGEGASLLENRHRWHLAKAGLLRARGDLDGALDELHRAASAYLPGFFPDVRPIPAAIARIRIAQGRLEDGWDWAHEHRVTTADDLTYLSEYNHLTLARLLVAQHRAEGSPDRLTGALDLLDRLLAGAQDGGRGASVVDARLLKALVHDARGERVEAMTQLDRALADAVPAGYVRLFLDEGASMEGLLRSAEQRPRTGELARAVLGAAADAAPASVPRPADDPAPGGLSEREVDVLRMLATSLTGPEIAQHLFMSVNTFRTHSRHIFTKLDVKTRRAAVTRAGELDLL